MRGRLNSGGRALLPVVFGLITSYRPTQKADRCSTFGRVMRSALIEKGKRPSFCQNYEWIKSGRKELLSQPPQIGQVDVLAAKVPK